MFTNNFRYNSTKTGKYVKELPTYKLPITESRIEELLLVRFFFNCCFCSGRWSKNFAFFLGHIAISQLIYKIGI